jgi:peptidoglycan/LPS O-acetylase OafA/YrhL
MTTARGETSGSSTPIVPRVRFHQLDGLRAVAATLVVIHHCAAAAIALSLSARGHRYAAEMLRTLTSSGVELFFVLSGVVLLRPYLRNARPLAPVSYIRRRAQRLWPPFAAAWVVSGVVVWIATKHPTWWSRTSTLPDFSFSGWFAQLGIVYLGRGAYNFAWWSLTVEVLFYLIVPLLVSACTVGGMTRTRMFVMTVAAMVIALMTINLRIKLPFWTLPFVSFLLYCPCFAGGVLLSRFDLPRSWGLAATAAGAAYCLAAFRFKAMNVHIGWGLFYTGVLIVAMQAGPVARGLSRWPLVWLGERSYSLFLVHFAIFSAVCYAVSLFIPEKGTAYVVLTRTIEVPLALFAAMLIFHFVERRFARNLATGDVFWPIPRGAFDAAPSAKPVEVMPPLCGTL